MCRRWSRGASDGGPPVLRPTRMGAGVAKKTNMEESEYGGLGRAEAQAKWEEWERLKEQNSAAAPFSDNSGPKGELCFWIRKPKQVCRFTSETQVVISCECPQTRFPVFSLSPFIFASCCISTLVVSTCVEYLLLATLGITSGVRGYRRAGHVQERNDPR